MRMMGLDAWRARARALGATLGLLMASGVAPALAATIAGNVTVTTPEGYCEFPAAVAAQLPGNVGGETRGAYMVDCTDLASLRYGSPIGAHMVIVGVQRQVLGSDGPMTRVETARAFTERLLTPNLGQWTVLGHLRLHVLAAYGRGRDDEAIASAEIEYMDGRRLVRQGGYIAATAMRGVPVIIAWTWPSGRDEAAATGPRLLAYLDELKAKNPDISTVSRFFSFTSGIGWPRILLLGVSALGMLFRVRRMLA
jgi:hypothetical protein